MVFKQVDNLVVMNFVTIITPFVFGSYLGILSANMNFLLSQRVFDRKGHVVPSSDHCFKFLSKASESQFWYQESLHFLTKLIEIDNVSLKILIPINWLINPRIFM